MQLSGQQKQIIEAIASNNANIMVVARAGCGKTTTILAATEIAKGKKAFFAFNKSIATELSIKAPKDVNVQTIHSLGFTALRAIFRYGCEINADKTFQITKNYIENDEWDLISPIKKLVGLCKNNLTDPTNENLYDLVEEYNIESNGDSERIFSIVRDVLKASIPSGQKAIIDFDDMIWLPNKFDLKGIPQFDWVFVDEAQDLNAAQQQLMLACAKNGKICFVGDPAQAIYHFRGADSNSMENMKIMLEDVGKTVNVFPLTLTRRCPKSIVKEANQFVKDFEALPEAPEGIIEIKKEINAVPGDMVLCRLNAPLIPVAYSFLRNNIPVKIQGRDIGTGLIQLIKKLKPISIADLYVKVDLYSQKEQQKLGLRYKEQPSKLETSIDQLKDKVDTLLYLSMNQNSIQELINNIERLFADVNNPNSVVLLSTVHKAKGLEAPTVWIIKTPIKPGKQENNIQYVAITRAKEKLVYVEMEK